MSPAPFQHPGRSCVYGETHMVATSHPVASLTAYDILEHGGNAVDAALAANAVLCVAEPHMTGLGGDCFVLYAPKGKDVLALNGSGRAPTGVDAAYLRAEGITKIVDNSPYAVTVPGTVDAWCRLHADHGSLPMDQLLAPAITLAEEGCLIAPRVAHDWQTHFEKLSNSPSCRRTFLNAGQPYRAGDRFANPALARTLRRIAEEGHEAFYQGEVAENLVEYLKGAGGVHTLDDFASQTCNYVAPLSTAFQNHDVFECPPNGQGIIALMILNILEHITGDLDEADYVHVLAEATKLAYEYRDAFVADPAKADVSMGNLLSSETAQRIAAEIDLAKARPDKPFLEVEHKDTVYLCVVDKDGNAISFINSLFAAFGSTLFDEKTGVLLHSRGTGFSLTEGHLNELAPGKRPLHTIIPGMLMKDGLAVAPFGVMGGQYQATGHANFLHRVLARGLGLQQALDAPRSFAYGGPLVLEDGYDDVLADNLRRRGHVVQESPGPLGGGQVVWIESERGILIGASDPRKDGFALGR